MEEDNDQILLSWLSEYAYCKRRFYLRVIEHQDLTNAVFAEGIAVHHSVHSDKIEKRGKLIRVTGLHVYSETYKLYGICDAVEFTISDDGAYIPFLHQKCIACPVEYKHGRTRKDSEYNLQLTGQAICLSEMYGIQVDRGCIYYTGTRQRIDVDVSQYVTQVIALASEIAEFINQPILPEPKYMKRCLRCSVYDICSPRRIMVSRYMDRVWEQVQPDDSH